MTGLSAILLCGGHSSRMGTDKALLPFGGKTLLEHQLDKLRALGIDDILLSGHDFAAADVRVVRDVYPDRGPLGGLHACLREARHPNCLVLGVDVPLLSAATLRALIAHHAAHGAAATVLTFEGRPEPLIAVYRSDLWRTIEPMIATGGARVRALLEAADAVPFSFSGSPDELLNCNTPEDYERLLQMA